MVYLNSDMEKKMDRISPDNFVNIIKGEKKKKNQSKKAKINYGTNRISSENFATIQNNSKRNQNEEETINYDINKISSENFATIQNDPKRNQNKDTKISYEDGRKSYKKHSLNFKQDKDYEVLKNFAKSPHLIKNYPQKTRDINTEESLFQLFIFFLFGLKKSPDNMLSLKEISTFAKFFTNLHCAENFTTNFLKNPLEVFLMLVYGKITISSKKNIIYHNLGFMSGAHESLLNCLNTTSTFDNSFTLEWWCFKMNYLQIMFLYFWGILDLFYYKCQEKDFYTLVEIVAPSIGAFYYELYDYELTEKDKISLKTVNYKKKMKETLKETPLYWIIDPFSSNLNKINDEDRNKTSAENEPFNSLLEDKKGIERIQQLEDLVEKLLNILEFSLFCLKQKTTEDKYEPINPAKKNLVWLSSFVKKEFDHL